jgi:hypothetical protein
MQRLSDRRRKHVAYWLLVGTGASLAGGLLVLLRADPRAAARDWGGAAAWRSEQRTGGGTGVDDLGVRDRCVRLIVACPVGRTER